MALQVCFIYLQKVNRNFVWFYASKCTLRDYLNAAEGRTATLAIGNLLQRVFVELRCSRLRLGGLCCDDKQHLLGLCLNDSHTFDHRVRSFSVNFLHELQREQQQLWLNANNGKRRPIPTNGCVYIGWKSSITTTQSCISVASSMYEFISTIKKWSNRLSPGYSNNIYCKREDIRSISWRDIYAMLGFFIAHIWP